MSDTHPHLSAERDGPVTVAIVGPAFKNIDDLGLEEVTRFLLELTGDHSDMRLVVDLEHTEFFGSAFLGILFRVWNRLNGGGGVFALCSLRPHCREVIKTARLDTLWPIYDTRDEAVRALTDTPDG